jgi:hypothetical protein
VRPSGPRRRGDVGLSEQWAVKVVSECAYNADGVLITEEDQEFWITWDWDYRSDGATVAVPGEVPASVRTFLSYEDAKEFAQKWKSRIWYVKPKKYLYKIIRVRVKLGPIGYEEYTDEHKREDDTRQRISRWDPID